MSATPRPWWRNGRDICQEGNGLDMLTTVAKAKTEANADLIVRAVNAHDALVAALRQVVRYAQSGYRAEGAPFYCLACDESLTLLPGAAKGQRAALFDEIKHDPECPVPAARAALALAEGKS